MTFLLDANVLLYSVGRSEYRAACLEIIEAVVEGSASGRTSTAVLEEVWHVELSGKAGPITGLTEYAYDALSPLLPVTDEIFQRALRLDAPSIGANDRVHVATCLLHEIEAIVSADRGFDDVKDIRRIDPLDDRARRRLLSASR